MTEDEVRKMRKIIESVLRKKARKKLDLRVLARISDEDLVEETVDHLTKARFKDDPSNHLAEMTPGLRHIYLTWLLDAEVKNGGLHQFFWNNEHTLAAEAAESFRALGAQEVADLVKRAIVTFSKAFPQWQKLRRKGTLKAFAESRECTALDKLDDRYYERAQTLESLQVRYIRSHLEEFRSE